MKILQTIVSYLAIAAAVITSCFSWRDQEMIPFANDYTIPDSISEYKVIATQEKNDWQAEWIWAQENPSQKNVWMCFSKKINQMLS